MKHEFRFTVGEEVWPAYLFRLMSGSYYVHVNNYYCGQIVKSSEEGTNLKVHVPAWSPKQRGWTIQGDDAAILLDIVAEIERAAPLAADTQKYVISEVPAGWCLYRDGIKVFTKQLVPAGDDYSIAADRQARAVNKDGKELATNSAGRCNTVAELIHAARVSQNFLDGLKSAGQIKGKKGAEKS